MTINGILLESSVSRFTGGGEWEFVFPSPAATVWSVALFQTESKFQNVFDLKSLLTLLYLANLDRVIKYFYFLIVWILFEWHQRNHYISVLKGYTLNNHFCRCFEKDGQNSFISFQSPVWFIQCSTAVRRALGSYSPGTALVNTTYPHFIPAAPRGIRTSNALAGHGHEK